MKLYPEFWETFELSWIFFQSELCNSNFPFIYKISFATKSSIIFIFHRKGVWAASIKKSEVKSKLPFQNNFRKLHSMPNFERTKHFAQIFNFRQHKIRPKNQLDIFVCLQVDTTRCRTCENWTNTSRPSWSGRPPRWTVSSLNLAWSRVVQ